VQYLSKKVGKCRKKAQRIGKTASLPGQKTIKAADAAL
jgi:hypothetical protein